MADDRLGHFALGSVHAELEAAFRGDGDSGGGGGGESKVRQPPISDSGEGGGGGESKVRQPPISDSGEGGGGGESKAPRAFDPVEMLQIIRRENAQLASHGETGSVTWETLYGNMKTLYDYEKRQPKFYKRMIRRKCLWAKIKILERTKSYKVLCECYIFRDVDRDTILGPNAAYNLGYLFPGVLSAPQGRQWVQGGYTEVDDRYNHEGDERSAWDEVSEFENDHKVVAEPYSRAVPFPRFWYKRGRKLQYGVYTTGDPHPTLNTPYGGHLESAASVEGRSIGPPIPLATTVIPLEEGGGGGESKAEFVAHRAPDIVSASAMDDDVPNPDEMGGGRKRRKKTRRKKKRKTKRLRRKKRKTKRRRKKKRTRRKR